MGETKITLPRSILPDRMLVLSGSALKMIAVITMLIDHIGAHILAYQSWANEVLFTYRLPFGIAGTATWCRIARDIGRIAMPIFVFLLVEGFMHTHSRLRYGRNLLLFALISEIPWNYVHTGTLYYARQNVFFTLLLGYLGMWAYEYFWEKPWVQLVLLVALLAVSMELDADYGWKGYVFVLLMYLLRNERPAQAVVGSSWLYFEWKACFSYIFMNMYNGKRGFIKGNIGKYFFYVFYPLHLGILGLIRFGLPWK